MAENSHRESPQESPYRVVVDLGRLLSPEELKAYRAKAEEMGRNLRDHTVALLFGPDRLAREINDEEGGQ